MIEQRLKNVEKFHIAIFHLIIIFSLTNISFAQKTVQCVVVNVAEGNVSSHVFHRAGCKYFNCKNCTKHSIIENLL